MTDKQALLVKNRNHNVTVSNNIAQKDKFKVSGEALNIHHEELRNKSNLLYFIIYCNL